MAINKTTKYSTNPKSIPKEFTSVQEMVDYEFLEVGDFVKTLGYYAPGDGGGNDYEIVAAGTDTDDGGSYIDLSGSGLQAKGLFNGFLNVKQFGSTANGIDNDTIAFQAAVDYVSGLGGGEVHVPRTSFRYIIDRVTIKDGVTLVGEGRSSLIYVNANTQTFIGSGSIETGESNTLLSDASIGDTEITLSSGKGANFASGDWAIIISEATATDADTASKRGEIVHINSVSTDTLTVSGLLNFEYLTADSAQVQRINFANPGGLRNLSLYNPDPANTFRRFVEFTYCYKPTVDNVWFENGPNSGVAFQGCVGAHVLGCQFTNMLTQFGSPSGFGYCVHEAAANSGLVMTSCTGERIRHLYTTTNGKTTFFGGSLDYGVPIGSRITGCTAIKPYSAGFDTHAEGFGIGFSNCSVIDGFRNGFQSRAVNDTFTGCTVVGSVTEGFRTQRSVSARFMNCSTYNTNMGIDRETSDDATTSGAFLDAGYGTEWNGCRADRSGGHGFYLPSIGPGPAASPLPVRITGCSVNNVGILNSNRIGLNVLVTEAVKIIVTGFDAVSTQGAMSFGIRTSSATPTCIASSITVEGDKFGKIDGNWLVLSTVHSSIVSFGTSDSVTISGGVADITESIGSIIKVNGEGGTNDDLVTLTGGYSGSRVILQRQGSIIITAKHSIGNIYLEGSEDFPINGSFDYLELTKIGSNWVGRGVSL